MPEEPTRRIEQELRTYAEQRRAEAGQPFALHPVNRKSLQDEVALNLGGGGLCSRANFLWLKLLWPRLALAGAVCLIGAFLALRFIPTKTAPEYEMVKAAAPTDTAPLAEAGAPSPSATPVRAPERSAERAPDRLASTVRSDLPVQAPAPETAPKSAPGSPKPTALSRAAAPMAPVASAPAESSPAITMTRRYGSRPASNQELTPTGTTPEPPPPSLAGAYVDEVRQPGAPVDKALAEAGTRAPAPTMAAPPAPQSSVLSETAASFAKRAEPAPAAESATFAFPSGVEGQVGQRFVQIDTRRRNFNSPPPPPVLRSFQLRQSGSQIEIVDADGSIYRGAPGRGEGWRGEAVGAFPAEALARPAQIEPVAGVRSETPVRGLSPAAAPGLQFYVVGTNLTLNQRVAFEGEVVSGTNVFGVAYIAGSEAGTSTATTSLPTSASTSAGAPRPLLRIRGQATIGEATKLGVDAATVPR